MKNVPEIFGSMVFSESVMKERLPKETYKALKKSIQNGTPLELDVANVVAAAMKDWALEKGVTHYTHWFQPMTGITAEKHDSFISPEGNGKILMEFSGKELVKGEPDASSFPSGGLRATFEARGYTAWDPTSYAFIKDDSLYIPTAFCSYSGEALDKKTPLLRSMQAIDIHAMRVLRLFGNDTAKKVTSTVGPEQEYFLIDKEMYEKRPDLIYTGRTLMGAKPPKGQELDDHYFGSIKKRVSSYMKDLDEELWKLGVCAKTKHNEVAPAQHELATIFTSTNIATDNNQLTMETMKAVAARHDMVCLLHEKPFAGINGSGKHNNWSLATDTGINLLEPTEKPAENVQFLLFLSAVIKAVDEYQELLRVSVASAGNDHRLGANEAPPAIVSMFLGEELTEILDDIEKDLEHKNKEITMMDIGASVLPRFPKDNTDRNRTSPFAFTGNKFEFRALGSTLSVSGPNIVLNTIVAEELDQFATRLEAAENFTEEIAAIIKETIQNHKRIIFNGNGYDESWVVEAEKRGLANLKTSVDALPEFVAPKSIEVFTKHGVFTEGEIHSRYEILLENYSTTINIEALTMIEMVKKSVFAAVVKSQNDLLDVLIKKKELAADIDQTYEEAQIKNISSLTASMATKLADLEAAVEAAGSIEDALEVAKHCREKIFAAMNELRAVCDELETIVPASYWPYPSYGEILFSIK